MKINRYFFDIIEDYRDTLTVVPVPESKVRGTIEYPCHLFLDQATKTGYVIYDDKRRLVTAGLIVKDDNEELVEFKYGLRDVINDLIDKYQVSHVWHEEAYDAANHWTTEVLMYIKHMIKDLSYERGRGIGVSEIGRVDDITVLGLDHTKWKSLLAKPKTFKRTGDDKKQVAKFVGEVYPLLNLPEDTRDALGMGIAIVFKQSEKNVLHNARINKKLPVFVEVMTLKPGEQIEDKIAKLSKKFRVTAEEKGIYEIDYVTKKDELMNARYFLSFKDAVCWSRIPYHTTYGQLLLHYNIVPKHMIEGEEVIMIACRKK